MLLVYWSAIILLLSLIVLSNCTSHSVKLGKKCTKLASNNTYEKSIVWIVDKKNIEAFENKINKENCKINGENKSLDTNTPTSKLLEKSGNGNNKNPPIKPITIAI